MLLLWLMACDVTRYANLPPATDGPFTDGSDTSISTGDTGDFYDGPIVIERWSVDCPDNDETLTISVDSAGWTNGIARAWLVETSDVAEPWDEEHPVRSTERDPRGSFERHRVDLADQVREPTPGVSTQFDCATNVSAAALTWVIRIYDPENALADCIAFGHDPWGLVLGAYDGVVANGGATDPEELGDCRVVTD